MLMGIPHFLCIPFPVQGHVNPLMQFSQLLAKHGCKVTFVHTEFNHKRAKTSGADNLEHSQVGLVTLPDGLDAEDDRSDVTKVLLSIKSNMPALLPKLIEDVNALDVDKKITCIIVTFTMSWALEVGHRLGIKGALLCPASATSLASVARIPKLIDDGIIDSQGLPTKKQEIQLSPNMPTMNTQNFPWRGFNKIFFDHLVQELQTSELGEWWLCNTTYDLEPGAFSISPKFLSIGPLMESESNKSSFWEEDTTCLEWLDQQQPQSVIYVSFGSLAVLDPNQFGELALALDLLDKPFIWVVRPSNDNKENANAYPHDFHGSKGKIIGWAPQKKILNHPALACFISHCGWNSTLEGICAGVPFLCWPCATDQYLDTSYICDVWKIGLGLDKDENGIILREEIRKKANQLLVDEDIKARSLKLKDMIINNILEGGQSSKNLNFFMDWANSAVIDHNKLKELALGLDFLDTSFLWVVRPSNDNEVNNAYFDEFHGSKGRIVGCTPQKKILNHPAIACFISHCGWNSTIEGVCGGVPFLCWPLAQYQFVNKSHICDVWKVGLGLDKDENGFISKGEIRKKVEQLLGDDCIKARSLKLKELTLNNTVEGGHSSKNLKNFISWAD